MQHETINKNLNDANEPRHGHIKQKLNKMKRSQIARDLGDNYIPNMHDQSAERRAQL